MNESKPVEERKEVAGVLRPKGGTNKFRRNCCLVAEADALAVTDRNGVTTRFPFDGSESAPKEMMTYLHDEPFIVLDGEGCGIISSPFVMWDADESAEFCDIAGIGKFVTDSLPLAPLRPDGVRLEEPSWLRHYVATAPFVLAAGVLLAALGRALNLPVWLMLPFLPWLLMYPIVRATGYFAPRLIGPSDIGFQKMLEDQEAKRKAQEGEASTP
jgi:hypothetical protein